MSHTTDRSLKELGDKIEAGEKESIEKALADLKEVMKGSDIDMIKSKTEALTEASSKMAERLYAQGEAQPSAASDSSAEQAETTKKEDVLDAEFEEVKDSKK